MGESQYESATPALYSVHNVNTFAEYTRRLLDALPSFLGHPLEFGLLSVRKTMIGRPGRFIDHPIHEAQV